MPPHIEVDAHHDDDFGWQLARPPPVLSTDQPSPLFLDYESVNPQLSPTASTACSLSRRQSDPDFTALVAKDDAAKVMKEAAAPVVSVITAIIGPESAYVRNTGNDSATSVRSGTSTATTTATATKSPPKNNKQQPIKAQQTSPSTTTTKKSAPVNTSKGKIEKPILLRATRYVSKKGWKVVKSLPKRVVSSVGSVKVPGHHRNVV